MGHQHHFLSRLDRVSAPHVELALSLYRDAELLEYILGQARIPEAAERVAISMDHPEDGPFLIVTRDGKFVTCLGTGMSPGQWPVITRGQLDGIAAKGTELRSRLIACRELAGARGGTAKLLKRIYEAADELSREEFIAISALQPVYAMEFIKFLFETVPDIQDTRDVLVRALRKSDRLKPMYRDVLFAYWQHLWAIGHLSVLSAMDGRGILDRLPAELLSQVNEVSYSWGAVRQGVFGIALKGLWGAARFGKVLLPGYKRRFAEAGSHLTVLNALTGLAALGMRHSRLRAEVQKLIVGGFTFADERVEKLVGGFARALVKMMLAFFENPEAGEYLQREIGADLALLLGRTLKAGSPFRFERREDVPVDLALTLAVHSNAPYLPRGEGAMDAIMALLACLPWVARAEPEQLYLPRDYLRATRLPWDPECTLSILRRHRDYYGPLRPKKAEGPARKGPCPCGSGKKYKRCCGADDKSDEGDEGNSAER